MSNFQETTRRVINWFKLVLVLVIIVPICFLVLMSFIGGFSSQASTMTGKAATVYNFLVGNLYMTFLIFALIILGAVIKIFLFPSQPQYSEYQ